MQLVPSWAPNVHPMIIHFPIVLALLALLVDAVQLVRPGARLAAAATTLLAFAAAAGVAAYLSGSSAASTVLLQGAAHDLVNDHRRWALATTGTLFAIAVIRGLVHLVGRDARLSWRVACLLGSLGAAVLVQQTAERGARLVYEHGVGVVPAPFERPGR